MSSSEHSTESVELSSSSEIHPNIDEKSYKNWKRETRKNEKRELKEKLKILKNIQNPTEQQKIEKENLEKMLKPQFTVKSEDSFRTGNDQEIEIKKDVGDILVELLENQSLEYFSDTINKNRTSLNDLEELILYNLSENIKEDNDEMGLILSQMCLLMAYFNTHGKGQLDKLIIELKIPDKKKEFIKEIQRYYQESKDAILKIQ
ncbi:uncharacterized protein VNE69_12088 [Vairimorpha necatrix]|uniref:Cdc37 N-terminal domain-containing protein n=1 Tax=Vairimorpha necatrix TaxID=6039 RepID=A0AAX4JGI9_9MICR